MARPWVRGVALAALAALAAGCAAPGGSGRREGGGALVIAAEDATYLEVVPGVSKAALWGDPQAGAYGTFTKFAPGLRNPLHTHAHEVRILVLKGAYVYEVDGVERRVRAGSFISVPGGLPHVSGGDAFEGALFLETAAGPFDLTPVR